MRGTLRIEACVKVSGRTRLTRGPGTIRKQNHWIHQVMRRGKIRRGTRQRRERRAERQIVPRRLENVCNAAACTMTLDGVSFATEWRWKYHCETVAVVVDLPVSIIL